MLILSAVRNKDSGTHIFGWEAPRLSFDFWFAVRGDINGSIPHSIKLFSAADLLHMIRKRLKKKNQQTKNSKQQRSKQTIWSYYLNRSVGEPIRGRTSHLFWYKNQPKLVWWDIRVGEGSSWEFQRWHTEWEKQLLGQRMTRWQNPAGTAPELLGAVVATCAQKGWIAAAGKSQVLVRAQDNLSFLPWTGRILACLV